ncbi:MAG: threonine--tRNA ligase [Candidatus Daviesbacteria bacterium]|nr:threonine--tRNA ligase [Candidatus Daviesbacteria bacterium]
MSDQVKNHQQLGQELDLFTFSDLVGSGLPLFTPKGTILRRVMQSYIDDLLEKQGYEFVWIPHIAKKDLYEKSGHLEKFSNDMFPVMNAKGRDYILKPANCPHHTQIFARKPWSYKDMPQRYAESTTQYRSEQSGELEGLARVLGLTLDDSHIFARADQIKEEFRRALEINKQMLKDFQLEYWIRLSAWDPANKEKYLGDADVWEKMQTLMEEILKETDIEYKKVEGEAAFYGPKMDLIVKDSLGKEWQLSTIQVDFNLPERFNLEYTGEDGKKERPVMLHRATFGSYERFLAMIIEHFQGAFPTWLSPVQVTIVPITDRNETYAQKVLEQLKAANIRAEVDSRAETMQNKIRNASEQKVPYVLVVGDREEKDEKVAVRQRGGKDLGVMDIDGFLQVINSEIELKSRT